MAGRASRTWTPKQRKAHGDKVRAACKLRNERRHVEIELGPETFIKARFRSAALTFWNNLVSVYEGKPLCDWLTEEFCVEAIKDAAKRAAGMPLQIDEENTPIEKNANNT